MGTGVILAAAVAATLIGQKRSLLMVISASVVCLFVYPFMILLYMWRALHGHGDAGKKLQRQSDILGSDPR